jgi:hypothetical protein
VFFCAPLSFLCSPKYTCAVPLSLFQQSVPKTLSCLNDTRFDTIHDMVYAFRTQKNPVTHKRRSAPGLQLGPGAGSNPRVDIQQQIRAQKLLLEHMQITRANGAQEARPPALAIDAGGGRGGGMDTKVTDREDEKKCKDKNMHHHKDEPSSTQQQNYRRSTKIKKGSASGNKRGDGSSSAEPFLNKEGDVVATRTRKPTPPLDVNFHSASRDPNWGARYRMLSGQPKAASSGGGFMRKKASSNRSGSGGGSNHSPLPSPSVAAASSSRRERSQNTAKYHYQKPSPIPGPSSSSSLRWGSGGSLAAQLAQARASILDERMSLGLEDSTMGSLTDLGERSYRFGMRASDATSSGTGATRQEYAELRLKKSSGHGRSSSRGKREKRHRRRSADGREGSRDKSLRDTSSSMRSTVSATSLFNQKQSRKDRGGPLRSRRQRKGRPGKGGSGGSSGGSTVKVPVAPIPQKTARFLSPLLGSQTTPRLQLEEQ